MASHHQHSADIIPFGQPLDYERRGVKPIPAEQIARIMGESVDLYRASEEAELRREAVARRVRIQAIIEWLAIAAVIFASIYFAIQLVRGAA